MGVCVPFDDLMKRTKIDGYVRENDNRAEIEKYVLLSVSLFAILFLLSGLNKRLGKIWLKLPSSACYILIPVLFSNMMGLTTKSFVLSGERSYYTLYSIWASLLLFTNAGFDTLTAFDLRERDGRSKLLAQFLIQYFLLLLILVYNLPYKLTVENPTFYYPPKFKTDVVPILLVFCVVCLKVWERLASLAYAGGATRGVRQHTRRIINYMNQDEEVVDPVSMQGFKYLVGPRYSVLENSSIVDGITLEKMWRFNGTQLLSSKSGGGDPDGMLKDTCLSFSLFWLLLGKFWGYPLYQGKNSTRQAWKLVSDGLLAGDPERAFRVIEVELSFLNDFFYSKYIFFYLNGFYWKLYSVAAFPIMIWWFTVKGAPDYKTLNEFMLFENYYDTKFSNRTTVIVLLVLFALEVIQFLLLLSSRWLKVALLSYYAKRERAGLLDFFLGKFIVAICRISLYTKSWGKREIDQYSLLESCTCWGVGNRSLLAFGMVFGIPFRKPGRKQSSSVVLSDDVKKAVGLSLKTNGPKLSKGITSLRRNGVEEQLTWACELKNTAEIILAWHLATSVCEMGQASSEENQESSQQQCSDQLVATKLSNYCAYLLFFRPSLLPVHPLEAEATCDLTLKEARELLKTPGCPGPCGQVEEQNAYEKLKELIKDNEVGGNKVGTTLQKGVRLGMNLVSAISDKRRRWKILADFWAEMILFLAPSDTNEMDHAEMLAEGGEFITHIWALLFHAGIVHRDN